MKNGEYVLTEDTGAILNELYGGIDEASNALYLGRLATILSESTIDSEVRVFQESDIEASLSEKMVATLEADPYAVCVILDRFLARRVENNPVYANRVGRFSVTRGYDGKKISRIGQPSLDEQVSILAETYKGTDINRMYLVDDGFFTGGTAGDVRDRLASIGIDVSGVIGFLQSNEATVDSVDINGVMPIRQMDEWIDIRDVSMFGGKINKKGQSGRAASTVPYIAPWANGSAASLDMLPDFLDISQKILVAQIDLLQSYEEKFGSLTVRDMVKAGFAVPTNIEKTIPISLNTNVIDYLQMCRDIVEREQQRSVVIIDMDGTLYDLVSEQGSGFDHSQLKQKVDANALRFIANLNVPDPTKVLYEGLNNPIGISAYLEKQYVVDRKVYFDDVWNIDPEGIVKRDEVLISVLIAASGGNIGSEKPKLVLLTAAPSAWVKNVLQYLGLENVFEDMYSGESYGQKQEVMEVLVGRYDSNRMVSIGDQMATDILPAEALGITGKFVSSTSDTVRAIQELRL